MGRNCQGGLHRRGYISLGCKETWHLFDTCEIKPLLINLFAIGSLIINKSWKVIAFFFFPCCAGWVKDKAEK